MFPPAGRSSFIERARKPRNLPTVFHLGYEPKLLFSLYWKEPWFKLNDNRNIGTCELYKLNRVVQPDCVFFIHLKSFHEPKCRHKSGSLDLSEPFAQSPARVMCG